MSPSQEPDPLTWVKAYQFTKTTHRDVYPAVDPAKPQHSMAGKVVVVTGAGRGLGLGIVKAFAQAGAKAIVAVARSGNQLDSAKAEIAKINSSVEVLSIPTDITISSAVKSLFQTVSEKLGAPDILVNNAGLLGQPSDLIGKVDEDMWWRDYEVNVKGIFLMTQNFLKAAGEKETTVINTSTGLWTPPTLSSYFSSKTASMKLTELLDIEYPNVRAYALHPGIAFTDQLLDPFIPFAGDTPELFGGTMVYLASQRPEYLSGRWIVANWDMEELEKRKKDIVSGNLLKMTMNAKLGHEQFV